MTGEPEAKGGPHTSTDEEFDSRLHDPRVQAWFEENLPELRRSVSGQRILYRSLAIAVVVGLAAHVGGYFLITSAKTPLGLLADLLHALGWALWTGVVVVVFVQVLPEAKRRQIQQALDAYEAAKRDKARAGSDQAPGRDGARTAS